MATHLSPDENKSWKKPFFTIWSGQAFSIFGSQLVQFALIWYLTKTTGSGTVLATASIAGILPQVLVAPFAGAMVDRMNRRMVMIISDTCVALATLTLAVLFALDVVQIWHIYLVMFIRSICGNFQGPAMMASTSLMVPKDQLTRIQGLNTTLFGSLNIITAPLGALLMEVLPIYGIIGIDVCTAIIAILPLLFIPIPQPAQAPSAAAAANPIRTLYLDMREGLVYMVSWKGLLIIVSFAVVINFLFAPISALMPLLVRNYFNGGALQLAWMETGFGVGLIAGGVILSTWGGFKKKVYTSAIGLAGMGLGTLLVAITSPQAYPLALVGMVISGLGNPITNGPLLAIVQSSVEPQIQGRVFTLIGSACTAMTPIGLALAGPLADVVSIQLWYWFGGIGCLIMAIGMISLPAVLNIENGRNVPVTLPSPIKADEIG